MIQSIQQSVKHGGAVWWHERAWLPVTLGYWCLVMTWQDRNRWKNSEVNRDILSAQIQSNAAKLIGRHFSRSEVTWPGFGALLKGLTSVVVLKVESAGYSLPPPTIPAAPETQTRDLQVTSPTRYPLGHDCPKEYKWTMTQNTAKATQKFFQGKKSGLFCSGQVNLLISTQLSMDFTCSS